MRNLVFLLVSIAIIFSSCSGDDDTTTYVGNWVRIGQTKCTSRNQAAVFTIGDTTAYIIGGYYYKNKAVWRKDVWSVSLNGNNAVWTRLDSIPESCLIRTGAVAFSIGAKGYYGLGYSGETGSSSTASTPLNDFWEFDPSRPKGTMWKQLNNFEGEARYGAIGFGTSEKGYVLCGYSENDLSDSWKFDPNGGVNGLGSWEELNGVAEQFPGDARTNGSTFTIDSKVYVLGGKSSDGYVSDFYVFDPSTTTWTKLRSIKNADQNESFDDSYTMRREYGNTFVINNKGYITCGTYSSIVSDTWEYDHNEDLWTRKTSFEGAARTMATSFTLQNRGFVMSGSNGTSTFLNNIFEFKPDAEVDDYDNGDN